MAEPKKLVWEMMRDRANALRLSAAGLKRQAEERSKRLPELALAAEEQRVGAGKEFDEAVAEADRLLAQSRQAELAAVALDEKAEETRKIDIDAERAQRVAEMSDLRAGYDHATLEMDKALKNVEDALCVLMDARKDFVDSLRRAEFVDQAGMLQRRASQMLQMSVWANAPRLADQLGVIRLHRRNAQNLSEAVGFLPETEPKEKAQ